MKTDVPVLWFVLNVVTILSSAHISSMYNTNLFRSIHAKHIPELAQREPDSEVLNSRRNGYPYQCDSYTCYDSIDTQYQYQYEYPVQQIQIEEVPVNYPYQQQQYPQTCQYTKFTQSWYEFCYMNPYSTCCYCQGCIWPIPVPEPVTVIPPIEKSTTPSTKNTTTNKTTITKTTTTKTTTPKSTTTKTTTPKTTTTKTTTPKTTTTKTTTTKTRTTKTTTPKTTTTKTTTPKTTTTTTKQNDMYEYLNI